MPTSKSNLLHYHTVPNAIGLQDQCRKDAKTTPEKASEKTIERYAKAGKAERHTMYEQWCEANGECGVAEQTERQTKKQGRKSPRTIFIENSMNI